jgi:sugar lactone lactonase YvrE
MAMRSILRMAAMALLSLGLSVPMAGAAQAKPVADGPFPDVIALPDGFQPEGIAIGPRATAYLGSLEDGDIYAVNLRTGEGSVISQGPGTPSVGLKIDNHGQLFVAGGCSGTGRVIDVGTGEILESYQFTEPSCTTNPPTTFINDVVLTRDFAWFTDSRQPQLYGVPLGPGGTLGDPGDVVTLELVGDWVQAEGFNANGIATTPNQKDLLVIQSATGSLFRVDSETGEATKVDLGGIVLANGDGLLVQGRTLYVVQNQLNQIAVIKLDPSGTSGVLVETLTSENFAVPTTVAIFGNSLYLPNAQFGIPNPETAKYSVTRIDRH